MKYWKNGICHEIPDLTQEELAQIQLEQEQAEKEYWAMIPYDEAVDAEIRKEYSVSQEFAILRQKEEKPEEYTRYYAYCEQCKDYVKSKKEVL